MDYLNELIDYSMGFPFYQGLNPLVDWIFNGFGLFLIRRSILAREGWGRWAGAGPLIVLFIQNCI